MKLFNHDTLKMLLKKASMILFVVLTLESCKDEEPAELPFIKETYTYKTVIIGTKEWMAEDLKNNTFCNEEPIPEIKDAVQWSTLKSSGWSYVNNDKEKYGTIGKLYNWYAVSDERNICPCGWHVPSWDELQELKSFLGGEEKAGGAMKATGTIQAGDGLWFGPNVGSTNSSGFAAIPNGSRDFKAIFVYEPYSAGWWISNGDFVDPDAPAYSLAHNSEALFLRNGDKKHGFAVRCVKD